MVPILKILTKSGPLASSDIQKELVLRFGLSRDAARKRIQRSYANGAIRRFIRLKAGGYIYYIADKHSKNHVISSTKAYLGVTRPELGRIVDLIDRFKIISIFELCRLINKEAIINKELNPDLSRLLDDLKHLEYALTEDLFLASSSAKANLLRNLVKTVEEKFEEEANLLYIARKHFLSSRLADNIQLYRTPSHLSLVNKFDAFGGREWRKKTQVILECNIRRPIQVADIIGYQKRIFSTIRSRRRYSPSPTFCYFIATRFTEGALQLAFEKGVRPIIINYTEGIPLFRVLKSVKKIEGRKKARTRGRAAESKGYAFESAIEKAYKRLDFKTETRKYFYIKDGEVTEEITRHRFTDIDVFLVNEKERKVILIECKSAKKQMSRGQVFRIIKNFERVGLYLSQEKNLNAEGIVIGSVNRLDIVDARRKSRIPVKFFSPYKFYIQHKKELKGEPKWLFSPPSEVLKSTHESLKLIRTML